jgi:hypothetical protein
VVITEGAEIEVITGGRGERGEKTNRLFFLPYLLFLL